MSAAGPGGIVWAFALGAFLAIIGPKASPRLVLQLYKARPLTRNDAPVIYDLLELLADRARLHCALSLCHIPSHGLNAFSVGDASEATIALTDGLLRKLRASELLAVMAHEISHIRNNDMRVMALADMISRLNSLFSFIGLMLLLFSLPLLLLGKEILSLPFVMLLVLAPTLSNFMQLGLSRTREFLADLDAVSLIGNPAALVRALEKMETAQVNAGLPRFLQNRSDRLLPSLFRSHPTTAERIRRLKELFGDSEEQPPLNMEAGPDIPGHLQPTRPPRRHISGLWY